LASETFVLAVSARLAGRYVPEIIEKTRNSGVAAVELDGVEGKPLDVLSVEKIGSVVKELQEAGLCVTALRGQGAHEQLDHLIKAAQFCGVKRVVLPLTGEATALLAQAKEAGLGISFFNTCLDSLLCAKQMTQLNQDGFQAGFTFSGAAFAHLGERPFLKSYSTGKLKRFIDQLDVEDCLYDGIPQPLAEGHGEVKELISILRCHCFRGPMVIASGNRLVGSLDDAATRYFQLLGTM